MNISVKSKNNSLKLSDIKQFETKLGIVLPSEYRDFLLKFNGGSPSPRNFDLPNEKANPLHLFYGIGTSVKSDDLTEAIKIFKGRIKNSLIPIASDPFGNQICLGVKGRQKGKVYFWDHESEGLLFKIRSLTLIADSFEKFIDGIYEYNDPNESLIEKIVRLGSKSGLESLLDSGYDIESVDEYDRTIIEICAIAAQNELIEYLFSRGASLRSSLEIAEKNAQFFDTHRSTVKLINELKAKKI